MKTTRLIIVGGFLGAGKTSLLYKAAAMLKERGTQVGLITNDQAANLVDTSVLQGGGNLVYEVSGSCFCCNFPGFAEAVQNVQKDTDGGITIAEPVGSCTDLSATILQPIKDKYREMADLAPLTVLADPERLRKLLDGEYATANYIMSKQFDEADIILINKIDLLDAVQREGLLAKARERWPLARIMEASVKKGTGIEAWLAAVLEDAKAGQRLASVDYDRYADGEAAYGWLNASYYFSGCNAAADSARQLLQGLKAALTGQDAAIGHVKFLLRAGGKQWLSNLTDETQEGVLREEDYASEECVLTVNARAEIGPKALQDLVLAAVDAAFSKDTCIGTEIRSLIPGRPNPTYRYKSVI